MKKQSLVELIHALPDEVDTEDLFERLLVMVKLERAERQITGGETISHDQFVQETQEWSS